MTLDLKLVLKAGLIWGIVGIILIVVTALLPLFNQFGVDGLTLSTYAMIFAGVHFSARNEAGKNILVGLIGGMLAGIIAALLLIAATYVLPMLGISGVTAGPSVIVTALIAGIAGAFGMEIVKRI